MSGGRKAPCPAQWKPAVVLWEPAIPDVSSEELAGAERLVVHCWAKWAVAFAQPVDAVLLTLKQEYPGIVIRSCDVDESAGAVLAEKFKITTVPTFVFFVRGKQMELVPGGTTVERIHPLLERWNAS